MDLLTDKPLPPSLRPPILNDFPGFPKTGGSCRCACHSDEAQRAIAMGLALFGGLFYVLGALAMKAFFPLPQAPKND